jgi:Ca2+-binding EF-hand superfamily protein
MLTWDQFETILEHAGRGFLPLLHFLMTDEDLSVILRESELLILFRIFDLGEHTGVSIADLRTTINEFEVVNKSEEAQENEGAFTP